MPTAAISPKASRVFAPEELAGVLMAIVVINGWNRIAIATGTPVGTYHTGQASRG